MDNVCHVCGQTSVGSIVICEDCFHDEKAKAIKNFLEDLVTKVM